LKKQLYILTLLLFCSNLLATAQVFFRKTDKGPYGTYVLYDQLPNLMPGSTLTINYGAPAKKLQSLEYQSGAGFIAVASQLDYDDEDISAFNDFLDRGNVLVFSAYFFSDEMLDWLNIKMGLKIDITGRDSVQIFDMDSAFFTPFHGGKFYNSCITAYDSSATDLQLLGKYNSGELNFISFKKRNGYVVIHTQPYMFSNYHLIRKKTEAYTEIFFSSLPGPITKLIWDEQSKGSSGADGFSALGFIMKNPPLRTAFWWALAGLLLVVFLSFKRRQRIMPEKEVFTNNTLDMVRTVSDMYFYGHRNEVMAKKKIAHWMEYLRVKYNVFSTVAPDAFWQTVQMRSNISKEKISRLRVLVDQFKDGHHSVTDHELIELNHLIDSFYTT